MYYMLLWINQSSIHTNQHISKACAMHFKYKRFYFLSTSVDMNSISIVLKCTTVSFKSNGVQKPYERFTQNIPSILRNQLVERNKSVTQKFSIHFITQNINGTESTCIVVIWSVKHGKKDSQWYRVHESLQLLQAIYFTNEGWITHIYTTKCRKLDIFSR